MAISWSRSEPGGDSPQAAPEGPRGAGWHRWPRPRRRLDAQMIAPLVLLTALWVAVSPRFMPLRDGGINAAMEVIIGLAVAGIGTFALVSRHGFAGRHFARLVLGVWVVLISSFMLDATGSMASPLYWSNTWSGAVLALLALAELAILRPPPADRTRGQ